MVTSSTYALPALGWQMQRSAIISLRKWKKERWMEAKKRGEKSNLIVWRLHMVPWLFGSPWLAASRLRPFTVSNRWQTSLSSLHPPLNIPPIPTLNLVRGIIEEANNEGAWGGVGKKKEGGVKWPAENTIKQDWNSKGLTMERPALFCATPLVGQDKGIPQYSKKGRKGSTAFERFRPQIQTLPP